MLLLLLLHVFVESLPKPPDTHIKGDPFPPVALILHGTMPKPISSQIKQSILFIYSVQATIFYNFIQFGVKDKLFPVVWHFSAILQHFWLFNKKCRIPFEKSIVPLAFAWYFICKWSSYLWFEQRQHFSF